MTVKVARVVAEQGGAIRTVTRLMEIATGIDASGSGRETSGRLRKRIRSRGGISLTKSPAVAGELRRVMKDAAGRPSGCVHRKAGISADLMGQLMTEDGFRTPDGDPIDEGNIAWTLSDEMRGTWIPNIDDDQSTQDEAFERRVRAKEWGLRVPLR